MSDDCISREASKDKLAKLINEMEIIFSDIREKNVDDSVCGLCEYDCDHGIDGYAYECPGYEKDDCFKLKDEYRKEWVDTSELPSVTPKIDVDALITKIEIEMSWYMFDEWGNTTDLHDQLVGIIRESFGEVSE